MSEVKRQDWSYCPECGGSIDTGYECNKCGRDWLEFHETRQEAIDKHAALQARITELEQALRLHLAVDPTDPILIEPVEKQLATLQAQLIASQSQTKEWIGKHIALEAQAAQLAKMYMEYRESAIMEVMGWERDRTKEYLNDDLDYQQARKALAQHNEATHGEM